MKFSTNVRNNTRITFIVRSKENRKYVELESFPGDDTDRGSGTLTLVRDSKVYLYTGILVHSKRGKGFCRNELVEELFRLLIGVGKDVP